MSIPIDSWPKSFPPRDFFESLRFDPGACEEGPFLSVIVRTQGRRPGMLKEVFLGLEAQSNRDFELIVICHKVSREQEDAIREQVSWLSDWLKDRTRVLMLNEGGRTRPLNFGFSQARGQYVAIHDDDDVVFSNWVDTFSQLAQKYPGRVLRSGCVRQDEELISLKNLGTQVPRAIGPWDRCYEKDFNFFTHIHTNQTPPGTLAFPRYIFGYFIFDEELNSTEDWDYFMRVVSVCGVGNAYDVTFLYRWWITGESSRTVHPEEEWIQNYHKVTRKMDELTYLLPKGATQIMRESAKELDGLRWQCDHLEKQIGEPSACPARQQGQSECLKREREKSAKLSAQLEAQKKAYAEALEIDAIKSEIFSILSSRTWFVTKPLRLLQRLLRARRPIAIDIHQRDIGVLRDTVQQLQALMHSYRRR